MGACLANRKVVLPAIVLGTGPSLTAQKARIIELREQNRIQIFGINNTYNDFPIDVWIACDTTWHEHFGQIVGDFDKWHWDKGVCAKYGYRYIEGRWGPGLSTDPAYIYYGHSSGYQALGLAYHYGHREIYLAGYDMSYSGQRHYFDGLSDRAGEYPEKLRKYSTFDGLIKTYQTIADQNPCSIYNITKDSGLKCFPYRQI